MHQIKLCPTFSNNSKLYADIFGSHFQDNFKILTQILSSFLLVSFFCLKNFLCLSQSSAVGKHFSAFVIIYLLETDSNEDAKTDLKKKLKFNKFFEL